MVLLLSLFVYALFTSICACVRVCLMIDKCWMWSIKLSISDLNNWSTQVVNVAKHLMVSCVFVYALNERMSEYACRVLVHCVAFHQNFVFVSNHFTVVYAWKETIFTNKPTDSRVRHIGKWFSHSAANIYSNNHFMFLLAINMAFIGKKRRINAYSKCERKKI